MSITFHHPGFLWFWIIKVEASNVTLREELDRFALEDFIFCNIFIFLLANFAKFANSLENTNTRFRQNFEVEKANWLDEKEKVNFQNYFHSVFSDFFTMRHLSFQSRCHGVMGVITYSAHGLSPSVSAALSISSISASESRSGKALKIILVVRKELFASGDLVTVEWCIAYMLLTFSPEHNPQPHHGNVNTNCLKC